ncbi:MAG: hypothetical protein ABJC05_06055 [Pyrinomonadaceae bacterium]
MSVCVTGAGADSTFFSMAAGSGVAVGLPFSIGKPAFTNAS